LYINFFSVAGEGLFLISKYAKFRGINEKNKKYKGMLAC
jgi:uncharacterized membrane protein